MNVRYFRHYLSVFLLSFFYPTFCFAQATATSEEGTPAPLGVEDSVDEGLADDPAGAPEEFSGFANNLRVGPVFFINFPHLLSYGIDVNFDDDFLIGINYGSSPKITYDSVSLSLTHFEFRGSYFFNKSHWYLGGALGSQSLDARLSREIASGATRLKVDGVVDAQSFYVSGFLGWMNVWESGLTLATGLGLLVPLKPVLTFRSVTKDRSLNASVTNSQDYQDLESTLKETAKKVTKKPMPTWDIIRLGYFF